MGKMFKALIVVMVLSAIVAFPSFGGQWQQDADGWRWLNDQGRYPANKWEWIDGNKDGIYENYYFDQSGYLLTNTVTPDGYQVDENGAQLAEGKVCIIDMGQDDWEWEIIATNIEVVGSLEKQPSFDQEESVEYEEIDPYELAYRIVELVNEKRKEEGRDILKINNELMGNAMLRAEEVSEVFGHTRLNGTEYFTAITVEHNGSAENIAWEKFDTLENVAHSVSEGWYNSKRHKSNMMRRNREETGVGIYIGDDGVYIVQLFI